MHHSSPAYPATACDCFRVYESSVISVILPVTAPATASAPTTVIIIIIIIIITEFVCAPAGVTIVPATATAINPATAAAIISVVIHQAHNPRRAIS